MDCEVAIVGCGPVGALLANLLGRSGIRAAVFEREREIYRLPRAVHFDHEVMRIFQSVGFSESMLGETAPISGYQFWNADRELLFGFDIGQQVTSQGFRADYMFHQPTLEGSLRDAAAKRESIAVNLEHEVISLEEHPDHVLLGVRNRATGGEAKVRASYVVACDGANSFVRKQAGLPLDDLQFDEPWLVIDGRIDGTPAEFGLPEHCLQLCDPARPVTFIPVVGPYIRWEFMLKPGECRDDMLRPERISELVAPWVDPARVELIRSAVYDFHALVAEQWNTRRVFLAGDAAHQTPPFLGQGMCAGMRDAANLAWKLELVLRHAASPAILGTYQPERAPHVRALIQIAVDMGRIICTLDPEAAAERDARFLSREQRTLDIPTLPGIANGLLQQGCALAGQLALQARIATPDGRVALLDDVVGPGFAVLERVGSGGVLSERARVVLEQIDGRRFEIGPDRDVDGAYAEWFARHECDAVLVRPDHYVYGTASGERAAARLLEELGSLLERPARV